MRTRKNTLLLFSKVPEPGKVKTRLTVLKDGIFAPETASYLYHCMLFDVVETISAALAYLQKRADEGRADARSWFPAASGADGAFGVSAAEAGTEAAGGGSASSEGCRQSSKPVRDTYELVISTTPASNVPVMEKLFADAGEWPFPITFIADEGASFDEHYNHAFQQAFDGGTDCILSMGADMPALTCGDVIAGFDALHRIDETGEGMGIVLAPDQEMGVSVIGWTRATDFSHTGVFYNQEGLTVLPAYIAKARGLGLPAYYLPPIPDVDTMADLRHAITVVEALNYCAPFDGNTPPWRTADAFAALGIAEVRVPPNDLHDPREEIDVEG